VSTLLRQSVYKKRATPTRPSYRNGATGGTGNASGGSFTVTVPAGAVIGDWAVLVLTSGAGVNVSSLSGTGSGGWTKFGDSPYSGAATGQAGSKTDGSQTTVLTLYSKRLVSGDPGAVLTVNLSASTDAACGVIGVYQNVGQVSIRPTCWDSIDTEQVNSENMRCPSLIPGPNDCKVFAAAGRTASTLGSGVALLTTVQTGATIRQTIQAANGSLNNPMSASVWDCGTNVASQYETFKLQQNARCMGVSFSLGPVAGVLAEMEKVPSTLVGLPVLSYGPSLMADVSRPEANQGYNTKRPWNVRIQNAVNGNNSSTMNFAMCGAWTEDICSAMYGTPIVPTQAVNGDTFSLNQSPNWSAWLAAHTAPGLVLMDHWGNDFLNEATWAAGTARVRQSAVLAVDAMIRLARSLSVQDVGDASLAYGGTWTSPTSLGYHGGTVSGSPGSQTSTVGTAKLSTVPGSTVTITTTERALDIILVGEDNSANSTVGATYSIKVNGVTYNPTNVTFMTDSTKNDPISGTPPLVTKTNFGITHNQIVSTAGGGGLFSTAYPIYKFCQMAVPIEGMPAGTNTIVITHTGNSGDRLVFNCWLKRNPTPPWITLNALPLFPDACYSTFNPANSTSGYQNVGRQALAMYSAATKAMAAQFTDGRVISIIPSETFPIILGSAGTATPGDGTSDYQSDSVHGLETWHAKYASRVSRAMNERIP
jgi:hypothetical protein